MAEEPLADTRFFFSGVGSLVGTALSQFLDTRGGASTDVSRLNDFKPQTGVESVLVVQYEVDSDLRQVLPELKARFPATRLLLLHEFTERGKVESEVLAVTDHLLEKPFTILQIERAISQFKFHPLAGKTIYLLALAESFFEEELLRSLGATVVRKLPEDGDPQLPLELAIFSPENLGGNFSDTLKSFRHAYADTPVLLIYDPQTPGTLDSSILNEIAYLIQKPVGRLQVRQKILDFFDQPQSDRRKNPRKKGISQAWVSAFNLAIGAPEIFESPFLIDVSQSGLSFQTYAQYTEGQLMAVWIISEDYPDRLIDLRGHIRWKRAGDPALATAGAFKYGLEFTKQDSDAYISFARMIAMH